MTTGDLENEFYRNRDQESVMVRNTITAPGINVTVALIAQGLLPAGVYEVTCIARYGAVGDVIDGMDLRVGGVALIVLPVQAGVNTQGIPFRFVKRLSGVQSLAIVSRQAGAVGAEYVGHIIATKIGD